ncbi:MAG: hypothetical protein ABSF95_17505 [Verrucomicrobiota bacterium]
MKINRKELTMPEVLGTLAGTAVGLNAGIGARLWNHGPGCGAGAGWS